MVILSFEFLLVFSLFLVLYWSVYRLPKLQNFLLIIAGLLFVASWSWQFLLSLVFVWVWTQGLVLAFSKWGQKKWLLAFGLTGLVCHLAFFKYTNFIIHELNASVLAHHNLTPLDIVMPLGISFYTFQAISYLVDVYKQKTPALPSPVFLGFLGFVPTIVAGPIFQAKHAKDQWLIWQDDKEDEISVRQVLYPNLAAALIMLALFKKVVLAGWLETLWVNPIFANPSQYNGLEVLTGIYAYSLQLFFDFSGYSDLAIAMGLLLGFYLPKNFNQPYLATDIQDFWNRWHMSLSTWIKEYIYIPLGGNRAGFWRVQFNVLAAFVISGVWHGAGWNFFVWGAIHGIALVWLNLMKKWGVRGILTKYTKPLACILTFHYVAFGWVFFRSQSMSQATDILGALVDMSTPFSLSIGITLPLMALAWLVYPLLTGIDEKLAAVLAALRWWCLPLVFAVFAVGLFLLAPDGLPGFIYANF